MTPPEITMVSPVAVCPTAWSPAPIAALNSPPVAVTEPPEITMVQSFPRKPPPMPAPLLPPVADTEPPTMDTVPTASRLPPPMPAASLPPVADREPSPPMVTLVPFVTLSPAACLPPFRTFSPTSVNVTDALSTTEKPGRLLTDELSSESESNVTSHVFSTLQNTPLALPLTVKGPALSRTRVSCLRE